MAQRWCAALAAVVIATACGGQGEVSSSTVPATPEVVVAQWLDAVTTKDTDALDDLVLAESLAFVIGAENRLDEDTISALVTGGIPQDAASGFWSSFADSYVEVAGESPDGLVIGSVKEFTESGGRFAAVAVGGAPGSATIILRAGLDGVWRVDMMATVGAGLTVPLVDLATRVETDVFRTRFEQWVLPALDAAARSDSNPVLSEEILEIRGALG